MAVTTSFSIPPSLSRAYAPGGSWRPRASTAGCTEPRCIRVQDPLEAGEDVVLRLDVQGARELQRRIPEAVVIFIEPPSVEEAMRRIRKRGSESPDEAERRLRAMLDFEMDFASQADYRVPNPTGELEATANRVWDIVMAERLRAHPRRVDPAALRPWSDPPVEP